MTTPTDKPQKINWQAFRAKIVDAMFYVPDAPADSAYAVRYGGKLRGGADTHDLANRVLTLAKADQRYRKLGRVTPSLNMEEPDESED